MSYIGVTSNNLKLRFIHIPKCAGMSVSMWYSEVFANQNTKDSNHAPRSYFSDDFYFWTIVRNPYDRAKSWYRYRGHIIHSRAHLHEEYKNEIVDWKQGINYWIHKRFDVDWFDPQNGSQLHGPSNNYFKLSTPMVDWLKDSSGVVSVDKIVKLENLSAEMRSIYALARTYTELKYKNKTPDKYTSDVLDDSSKKLVEQYYREDFELLGY